jgi:hypothetical protein
MYKDTAITVFIFKFFSYFFMHEGVPLIPDLTFRGHIVLEPQNYTIYGIIKRWKGNGNNYFIHVYYTPLRSHDSHDSSKLPYTWIVYVQVIVEILFLLITQVWSKARKMVLAGTPTTTTTLLGFCRHPSQFLVPFLKVCHVSVSFSLSVIRKTFDDTATVVGRWHPSPGVHHHRCQHPPYHAWHPL